MIFLIFFTFPQLAIACNYEFIRFWNVSCYESSSPSLIIPLIIVTVLVIIGFIIGTLVHPHFPTPWKNGFLSELTTRPSPPESNALPPPVIQQGIFIPMNIISPPRPPSVCSYFHLTHGD
ncbi:E3 RID-beta [simian adenovirus 55]|uniref:E3 RID-beta n=1 Tax=simian adenovirus 55 TaxID=2848082 RepID=A0A1L3INY6_9ADEN|nr:E3 RID-beta [Simian mastadenovirus WIV19]APG53814.1 E3 RID-beta [Simian mastadenovirus WIV19]